MREINSHRFLCEQVDGNSVSTECINGENVEFLASILRKFLLQNDAAIADRNLDASMRIFHVRKQRIRALRETHDVGVDLVKTNYVTGLAISRERAGAHSNHP